MKRGLLRYENHSLLNLGLQFGVIIAVPLLLLLGAGMWVDKNYGTNPAGLLVGFFVAVALSSFLLYWKLKNIFGNPKSKK